MGMFHYFSDSDLINLENNRQTNRLKEIRNEHLNGTGNKTSLVEVTMESACQTSLCNVSEIPHALFFSELCV